MLLFVALVMIRVVVGGSAIWLLCCCCFVFVVTIESQEVMHDNDLKKRKLGPTPDVCELHGVCL